MSALAKLLDVQALDLESDKLHEKRRTLPEREALVRCSAEAASIDGEHAELVERRESLGRDERTVGAEVADTAARAKELEDTLYSGTVKVARELETLQEEVQSVREKQSGIEERQMELLEAIDGVEDEIASNRRAREEKAEDAKRIAEAIGRAEAEIDDELAALAERRGGEVDGLPAPVLAEYDRLRTKERLGGRAAARLADGSCEGCRVRLPVLEYNKMKAEPEDALLCCPRCARVLVR